MAASLVSVSSSFGRRSLKARNQASERQKVLFKGAQRHAHLVGCQYKKKVDVTSWIVRTAAVISAGAVVES